MSALGGGPDKIAVKSLVDKLQESDNYNLEESKKALLHIDNSSLEATDSCAHILELAAEAFAEVSGYDAYQAEVNEWLDRQSGDQYELAKLLERTTLIGTPEGDDPIAAAQESMHKAYSVVARSYLMLRLRRDFQFGLSDLLKLRLTAALGYLRLQSESSALLALMAEEAKIAVAWLDPFSPGKGRQFHQKYHPSIVARMKDLQLYALYQQGSQISLHSRVYGLVPGLLAGEQAKKKGAITLSYQEIKDPVELFLWFLYYLRAHVDVIRALPNGLPEVEDLSRFGLAQYSAHLERLWKSVEPLARRKQAGLPDLLVGKFLDTT